MKKKGTKENLNLIYDTLNSKNIKTSSQLRKSVNCGNILITTLFKYNVLIRNDKRISWNDKIPLTDTLIQTIDKDVKSKYSSNVRAKKRIKTKKNTQSTRRTSIVVNSKKERNVVFELKLFGCSLIKIERTK
jgi:hypothetical protein